MWVTIDVGDYRCGALLTLINLSIQSVSRHIIYCFKAVTMYNLVCLLFICLQKISPGTSGSNIELFTFSERLIINQ